MLNRKITTFTVTLLALGGCSISLDRFFSRSEEGSADNVNWALHGNTRYEERYSLLSDINTDNVHKLGLAWYFDLPENRGQEATPLIVDGVMYTTSAWNHVHALAADSGDVLWEFDPEVPKTSGAKGCCDAVTRGLAYSDGKLYQGTLDGRLIALDAASGSKIWEVTTVDTAYNYTITGAPRVARGKVYIGNGGAEYGVRGYISAYNAETGELAWRFYTVPGTTSSAQGVEPGELMSTTWSESDTSLEKGGTVWDSIVYDPDTNSVIFGVGNGSPWNPNIRSPGGGDNLFLSSIVSVDADTGEYRWHYQTTPGEAWDFTATQPIILTTMIFQGTERKVAIQAPKNGFLYIIDRTNGQLLSANKFVDVNWASHVDLESGRPIVNPEAEYWKTGKPALVKPSWMGGHNWHPMALNPDSKVIYIPTQETAFPYLAEDEQTPSKLAVNLGVDTKAANLPDDPAVIQAVKDATSGALLARDLKTGKDLWRVKYPGISNGGVLATKGGLIFQGAATGFVNAYDASTGQRLWRFNAQTGVVAPPVSYKVNGEQYIAVNAGWGGIMPLMTGILTQDAANSYPVNRSRLLVFKLNDSESLPVVENKQIEIPKPTENIDEQQVQKGFEIYDRYCTPCHGGGAVGGGVIPDLRFSGLSQSSEAWAAVVLDGALENRGMISFRDELSRTEAESVRQYILDRIRFANQINDTTRPPR